MTVEDAISNATVEFKKAVEHLKSEFAKLQAGRANPALLESVFVEVYGSKQPLKNIATVSIPEPRLIKVQPWDKSNLVAIEKAIVAANLGLNPSNDGDVIRLPIPPLTQERRDELSKTVNKMAEEAKISVRNARQTAHNSFKQMKTDSVITEDDFHLADKKLQERVDECNSEIVDLAKTKEQDIMTV